MAAFLLILPFVLVYALVGIWYERKLAAHIQDRMGPTDVGFRGLLQTFADILKLLQKEEIVPKSSDRIAFLIAPVLIFVSIFVGFSVMPMAPGVAGSHSELSVFFLLAIVAFDVIAFVMAGWSSNNKYALLGAMRGVSQMLSYEVPVALSVLPILMICQSLSLEEIVLQQGILTTGTNYLFGLPATGIDLTDVGGITTWNIARYPLALFGLLVFFIATLAEANRAPFDMPEAESELIAGFQTEYAGFRWSTIMLGEYAMMILMGLLGISLFLGGWNTPLPNIGTARLADWTTGTPGALSGWMWGLGWLVLKSVIWFSLQVWARWTYPRLRADQLIHLCWKVLVPAGLLLVFGAAFWRLMMIGG